MPNSPFVDMPQEKPAELLATLRRARYGSLLARHILWLCATVRHPMEIATGPPQGLAPDVWVVPHALARCHAGPAPAGQPGPHGLGRDHASLAP
jgi:hypothetical protein